jgi:hypothetical protein
VDDFAGYCRQWREEEGARDKDRGESEDGGRTDSTDLAHLETLRDTDN